MADLVLPDDVDIVEMPIGPYHPGLIPSEGEYTQKTTYLATSPASWRGRVVFGESDRDSEAMGAKLNSILAAMRGGQKTLALPMPGPTIPEPAVATTVASIDSDGILTLNRNIVVPADAVEGYPADYWIRIAERIYVVNELVAADRIAVEPVAAAVVGERLHAADRITVRLQSTTPEPIPRTPEFWGRLAFNWIEAV